MVNGRTLAEDMEREYQRQSLRDTFAAAALPLCTRNFRTAEQIAESAYKLADAMLHERDSRTGQKMAESDSFCAVCPERERTIHDAAPAAKAETSVKELMVHATGEPGGEPESKIGTGNTWSPLFNPKPSEILPKAVVGFEYDEHLREHVAKMGDGKTAWKDLPKMSALMADWITRTPDWLKDKPQANQPSPPCVEKDGLSPGSRSGQINRTPERESPRRECGESQLRDVPQLDNSRAAGGPEHYTAKPAAWAVASIANNDLRTFHKSREDAESQIAEAVQLGIVRYADTMRVVPLYRQPQDWAFLNNEIVRLRLTDAEREAVEAAIAYMQPVGNYDSRVQNILRGLLERLA